MKRSKKSRAEGTSSNTTCNKVSVLPEPGRQSCELQSTSVDAASELSLALCETSDESPRLP